jgi:hypothetical protein
MDTRLILFTERPLRLQALRKSKPKNNTTMKISIIAKAIAAAVMLGGLTSTASALTATEANAILFMKQEEKLARDVYKALHAKWGAAIFSNIAASEQNHMNAVDGLISRYRLQDTTPAEAGQFTYEELQELYEALIEKGGKSLTDALEVGVLIEETDIEDLRATLLAVRDRPIRNVFSNLLNGSLNHLAAFRSWLK